MCWAFGLVVALSVALAQIVVGGARAGALRCGMGVEPRFGDRDHAAILAHPDQIEAIGRILVHPVAACELGGDAVDRALDAERLAAADARERLLLLEHPGGGAKGEARHEA